MWGLRGATSERVEITVPGISRPSSSAPSSTAACILAPVDIRVHQGITVTRPERTLVDVAGVVPIDVATSMLESAVHLGLTTPEHIWRYLSRYGGPGCRGAGRCGRSSRRGGRRRGRPRAGWRISPCGRCSGYGAPPPVRQYVIHVPGRAPIRLDMAYPPPVKLALEVDSALWHSDSESYRRDRAKWNLLVALGWTLLILTDFDLHERPEQSSWATSSPPTTASAGWRRDAHLQPVRPRMTK